MTKDFESERKSREELAENLKAMQKVNKSMETEIISLREKINEQSRERMYYTSTFDVSFYFPLLKRSHARINCQHKLILVELIL